VFLVVWFEETEFDNLRTASRNQFLPAFASIKRAKMSNKPVIHSMKELNYSNPVVFFDISIGGVPQGRMKFELYADRVPK
jgi:hypothetical protein